MNYICEKFKIITEKHTKLCLILLFILGIILYGTVAKMMTNPMFLNHDEELYVNMARSFFFEHNFSRGYELIDYTCVIYSIVISLAYFFYSAENIVFIMRMIGVIAMVSSIFPTYLLSKKILGSKTKALILSTITLIIPEMMSSSYLIQENLSYPMFLWLTYFIYCKFMAQEGKTIKFDITILLMLALIFFTKSYTIVFAFAYFLVLLLDVLKKKEYKKIKYIFVQGIIFCVLILVGFLLVNFVNGFEEGTNHYNAQILSIFPISLSKIRIFFVWHILLHNFLYILLRNTPSNDTNTKYNKL